MQEDARELDLERSVHIGSAERLANAARCNSFTDTADCVTLWQHGASHSCFAGSRNKPSALLTRPWEEAYEDCGDTLSYFSSCGTGNSWFHAASA
jgi:hypothetical protein